MANELRLEFVTLFKRQRNVYSVEQKSKMDGEALKKHFVELSSRKRLFGPDEVTQFEFGYVYRQRTDSEK